MARTVVIGPVGVAAAVPGAMGVGSNGKLIVVDDGSGKVSLGIQSEAGRTCVTAILDEDQCAALISTLWALQPTREGTTPKALKKAREWVQDLYAEKARRLLDEECRRKERRG